MKTTLRCDCGDAPASRRDALMLLAALGVGPLAAQAQDATMMEPRSPPGRDMKSASSHTSVMRWATPRMTAARNADRGGRGCGFIATVEAGSPPITSQISGCFSAITRHKLVPAPDPITERSSALRM